MFIIYFALWIVLNGRWTLEIGAFGLAFAAVLYVFTCKFMGLKLKSDLRLVRRMPKAIAYGLHLLMEIVKANMVVVRMILDRGFEPEPQLVRFNSGLQKEHHRVALADSITLTPGTITCTLQDDEFVVHCLDKQMVSGLDDGIMACTLRSMEQEDIEKTQTEEEVEP